MESEIKEEVGESVASGAVVSVQTQPTVDSVLATMADVITALSERLSAIEKAKSDIPMVEKRTVAKQRPVLTPKETGSTGSEVIDTSKITSLSFGQLNKLRYAQTG